MTINQKICGGESGIRTHGTCKGTHTFQACALNHSAISPKNYLKNSKFLPILSFSDRIGLFIGHLILTS